MAENTNIAWCDHTLNFWHGCTKVSELHREINRGTEVLHYLEKDAK